MSGCLKGRKTGPGSLSSLAGGESFSSNGTQSRAGVEDADGTVVL